MEWLVRLYNKMRNLLVLGLLLVLAMALDVRHCDASPQPLLPFTYIDGTPDSTTTASLCYDETYLYVNWQSIDTEIISTFNNCNDPLWQEDVVEIFIASPDSYPTNYFEFEVSPKSKLFFADITNANGDCSSLGDQFYDCGLAEYGVQIVANGWNAWFKVRLDTIGRGKVYNKYLINILRCDYTTNQPIRYLTWQPTYANPACFHKPAYFQEINLI